MAATKKRAAKKPVMTRQQVEIAVAMAGAEAHEQAASRGTDPKVLRALARGASADQVGGFKVGAASLNTMVALDRLWGTQAFTVASPLMGLVYMVYAYLNPDAALAALETGDDVFVRRATAFAAKVPMNQVRDLAALIKGHIADLMGDPGGAAGEAAPGKR